MKIAGSVDVEHVLRELSKVRPVFHSEADFQLAFAWEVKLQDPSMHVRLEVSPKPGMHLDLVFRRDDFGRTTVAELKYIKRAWKGHIDGELFHLTNHGAQDIVGYRVIKDITRVESFIAENTGANGIVILLTNDAYYWKVPTSGDASNGAAFRLGEGAVLSGFRDWGPDTGPGTKARNEEPLELRSRYELRWGDYSSLPGDGKNGRLRKLVIPVE